jgi:DNA-directed RNA polymerase omega subunit
VAAAGPDRRDHRIFWRYRLIQIPDNVDSKYRFVILSALRARQIQSGSIPLIKEPSHKATQLARKELQQGLVKFRIPDASEKKNNSQEAPQEE